MLSVPDGAAEDEDDDEVADGSLVELLLVEPLGEALIVPLAEPLIEPLGAVLLLESVLVEELVEPLG